MAGSGRESGERRCNWRRSRGRIWINRCFWVKVGAGCARWKVVLVLSALLRGLPTADVTSLMSELATDRASSLMVSVSGPWKRTAGSVVLRGGSADRGRAGRGVRGAGEGDSYVEARRGMEGVEKAERGRDVLLVTAEALGSRGAENSWRCRAAPECTNMVRWALYFSGKDAPRDGAPLEKDHKAEAARDQTTGGADAGRESMEGAGGGRKNGGQDMRLLRAPRALLGDLSRPRAWDEGCRRGTVDGVDVQQERWFRMLATVPMIALCDLRLRVKGCRRDPELRSPCASCHERQRGSFGRTKDFGAPMTPRPFNKQFDSRRSTHAKLGQFWISAAVCLSGSG
jgi:hypothetical protein